MTDWNNVFDYRDGKLFWKNRAGNVAKGSRAGCLTGIGYRVLTFQKKIRKEHRVIWELHNGPIPEGLEIDHINAKRDDNRIENLQVLTPRQNVQKRSRQRQNKVHDLPMYVTRQKSGRYQASILSHDRKRLTFGTFDTPEEAHAAVPNHFIQ